jgi:type III secretion system low calcium response chaperone LcrH/SycD
VANEANLPQVLQRWADGKATLKDVRGYTDEELYSIARTAYYFFYQGRVAEARTLFQGLYAVNPLDAYFARALGVVELAAGNQQGSLAAWDVAVKISPNDPASYVGRAETRIALGQRGPAMDDLRRAASLVKDDDALKPKISGMLDALLKK